MREYTDLNTLAQVDDFIANHSLLLIFISRTGCSICHGLLPQVQELLDNYPEIQMGHVNADHLEAIAGRFSIFAVPVVLLFVDGKEYLREARIVHMDLFKEKLSKIYEGYLK
ncbi:thioredoxin family protein [Lentibacillus sp.]|uniref:thioredoxin family protein n=1 Tax=Lentibacillus sp. TaxID=1925746 RepID=UPI002B4B587E|nr:thioredoxin family protein [Lentibacillus sp.]HLS09553.1 thioredoxin family protein [Lentibacillus sp.]